MTGPVGDPCRYVVTEADIDAASAGGEGLVFRAVRRSDGRTVALKLLTTLAPEHRERQCLRASAFDTVRHPNLMEHLEVFVGSPLIRDDEPSPAEIEFDLTYAVSAWVEGVPLVDAAADASLSEKLGWLSDLASALDHLHGVRTDVAPTGIVHRDVKPSNVRIDSSGRAVLVDFGVARPVEDDDATQGVGTYLWRAPEILGQAPSAISGTTDAWGLGAVAHWLFVGEPPALDGAAASRERIARALSPRSEASPVATAVAELLESDPACRPSDLTEWVRSLRRRLDARPISARRVLVLAVAVTALSVVGFGAYRTLSPESALSAPATSATSTTLSASSRSAGPVECPGDVVLDLSSDPPITSQPKPVTFNLGNPSNWVACSDDTGTGVTSVRVEKLSVHFARLGCFDLLPASGAGDVVIRWSDDVVSTARIAVVLGLNELAVELVINTGRFVGATGTASLDGFVTPLGREAPTVGDCDTGITSWNFQFSSVRFAAPSEG